MENGDWYGKPVLDECNRLRKHLQPISEKSHGPMEKASSANTLFPFVLLLGNHSSGKSSFINYVLNRKVQTTGVAPTDDNFTIIGVGDEDIDKDGPALVGDPDLGFSGLKNFGPVLVNHTQLKVRAGIAVRDFMIVDSPGMIDSPVGRTTSTAMVGEFGENMDRGYDFAGVCRWYAERADVILLFFDPDKPGTTGETLTILTSSLKGFDYKMHIILNKADQFRRIHDFARAYGSLCWNLSKVIPRKDLPRIHTMCLPGKNQNQQQQVASTVTGVDQIASNNNNAGNDDKQTGRNSPAPSRSNSTNLNKGKQQQQVQTSGVNSSSASFTATTVADDLLHSTYVATNQEVLNHNESGGTLVSSSTRSFLDQGILDLDESRAEVIREAFNAPKRRVDNEISRLFEDVTLLQMHCRVVHEVARRHRQALWQARLWSLGTAVLSVGVTVGVHMLCNYLANRPSAPLALTAASPAEAAPTVPQSNATKSTKPVISAKTAASNKASVSKPSTAPVTTEPVATPTASSEASCNTVGSAGSWWKLPSFLSSSTTSSANSSVLSMNTDYIYQQIVVSTGLVGLMTTTLVTVSRYLMYHRHLQMYVNSDKKKAGTKQAPNPTSLRYDEISSVPAYQTFEDIVHDLYATEFANRDKFTRNLAHKLVQHLSTHINDKVVPTLTSVPTATFDALQRILADDVANLRRRATPSFPSLSPAPPSNPSFLLAKATASPSPPIFASNPISPATSVVTFQTLDSGTEASTKVSQQDASVASIASPTPKSALKGDKTNGKASDLYVATKSSHDSNDYEEQVAVLQEKLVLLQTPPHVPTTNSNSNRKSGGFERPTLSTPKASAANPAAESVPSASEAKDKENGKSSAAVDLSKELGENGAK